VYSTIMVPLDGSALAEGALPFALRVGRATGGRLVLVRSVRGPFASSALQTAETYLRDMSASLSALGIVIEVHVYSDDASTAIVNAAELRTSVTQHSHDGELHAIPKHLTELIVMASHRRGGMSSLFHKSISADVLSHAAMPVMIVPPETTEWPQDQKLTLLVAVDGSSLSEVAFATAANLATVLDARLIAIQAVRAGDEEARKTATEYLDVASERYVKAETPLELAVLSGEPAEAIPQTITDKRVNLAVMATHGQTGAASVKMGRVAKQVFSQLTIPVVFVRPTAFQFERARRTLTTPA